MLWIPPVHAEAPAASVELDGLVLEHGSGRPVVGATVTIEGVDPVTTDEDGRFALALPPGTYAVTLEGADHMALTVEETFGAGERVEVEYRLRRFAWDEEVIVYGEHREEVSRQVVTIEELRRVPGSFGDPIRALQSLPGVARPSSVEGDIVVRGAEGLNTGTFVDDVRVPFLFHFLAGRSVVSPSMIEDVEFYPGGMPSRFGDVTQAVVNARTGFGPAEKGLHGHVHADLLEGGASMAAELGNGWTVRGAGRVAWISGLIQAGQFVYLASRGAWERDYRPARIKFPYNDWQLRIIKRAGPDTWSMSAIGALDGLRAVEERYDDDGDGRPDPYEPDPNAPTDFNDIIENRFVRMTFRWDHDTPEFDASTWVSVGNDRQRNIIPGLGVFFSGPDGGQIETGWFRVRHEQRLQLSEGWVTRYGLDLRAQPSTVESYIDASTPGDVKSVSDLRLWASPWVETQHRMGDLWVAPGFRASWHRLAGKDAVYAEPRASVRYDLSDRWTLTAFSGLFTQAPPTDRYADSVGVTATRVMQAWQSSAGIEGRWPSGLEVNANVYFSEMKDLNVKQVVWEVVRPSDYDSDVAYLQQRPRYEAVRGRAFGLETQIRLRPNNGWFGWAGVTVGRALRIDDDGTFPSRYDTPFSFVLVAARDLPLDIGLSGRLRLTSGQPYTPQAGVFVGDYYEPLPLERNSARYPFFKQLDVRIDKTFTGRRARWTVYLDVYNALNSHNPFLVSYDYDFSELRTDYYIPILPALGLQVEY
ncbi:MAG: TonB-dependent receptor [Alphaproteobacteria bacterium]|nr:TonB-dependent receptor [Alphaproteobacteria bacterium]